MSLPVEPVVEAEERVRMRTRCGATLFVILLILLEGPRAFADTVHLSFTPPLDHPIQMTVDVRTTVVDGAGGGQMAIQVSEQSVLDVRFTSTSGQLSVTSCQRSHTKELNGRRVEVSDPRDGVMLRLTLAPSGSAQQLGGARPVFERMKTLAVTSGNVMFGELDGFMSFDRLSLMLLRHWDALMRPSISLISSDIPLGTPVEINGPLQTALPRYDLPPYGTIEDTPLRGQFQVDVVEHNGRAMYRHRYAYRGEKALSDRSVRILNAVVWKLDPSNRKEPKGMAKTGVIAQVIGSGEALLDAKTLMIETSTLQEQLVLQGHEGSYRLTRDTDIRSNE